MNGLSGASTISILASPPSDETLVTAVRLPSIVVTCVNVTPASETDEKPRSAIVVSTPFVVIRVLRGACALDATPCAVQRRCSSFIVISELVHLLGETR